MVWSHSTRASSPRCKAALAAAHRRMAALGAAVAAGHARRPPIRARALFARDHMHGAVGIHQGEAGGIGKGRAQMPGGRAVLGRLGLDRQPVGLAQAAVAASIKKPAPAKTFMSKLPLGLVWPDNSRLRSLSLSILAA